MVTRIRPSPWRHASELVPDDAPEVASCTHNVVDIPDSLSMTIRYRRVLLKDWKAIEDAVRATMARYMIRTVDTVDSASVS